MWHNADSTNSGDAEVHLMTAGSLAFAKVLQCHLKVIPRDSCQIISFIDEMHTIVGADCRLALRTCDCTTDQECMRAGAGGSGGAMDAGNLNGEVNESARWAEERIQIWRVNEWLKRRQQNW
eukprot:4771945-Amphidinium_carterae.1